MGLPQVVADRCIRPSIFLSNFFVTQQMTKAFLPQMKAKNHGHIVTIASALGLFSTACVEVRHI